MIRSILSMIALAALCIVMAIPAVAQGPGPGPNQNMINWTGDIDQSAIVYFHGHHAWVDNVVGKPVINIVSDFSPNLPVDHRVDVHLDDVHGRGTVTVVHQPTADNNYTAAVQIRDPQPGRGHYHFRLIWND